MFNNVQHFMTRLKKLFLVWRKDVRDHQACSLKLTRRSCAVGLSMHPLETTRETTPAELRYVVAGSLMLTNLSTEQLVGLNGTVPGNTRSSGRNGGKHVRWDRCMGSLYELDS